MQLVGKLIPESNAFSMVIMTGQYYCISNVILTRLTGGNVDEIIFWFISPSHTHFCHRWLRLSGTPTTLFSSSPVEERVTIHGTSVVDNCCPNIFFISGSCHWHPHLLPCYVLVVAAGGSISSQRLHKGAASSSSAGPARDSAQHRSDSSRAQKWGTCSPEPWHLSEYLPLQEKPVSTDKAKPQGHTSTGRADRWWGKQMNKYCCNTDSETYD